MQAFLSELGLSQLNPGLDLGTGDASPKGKVISSFNPTTGKEIAQIKLATRDDYEKVVAASQAAFGPWRAMPAPKRGEIVRQIGNELRRHKDNLGRLVSLEMGKIYQEGLGEVQEMIDIADFAVGLSRQLYGLSMHSERPQHRMYEQWHPLGAVGVITAFNFPVAVWAWNALLAAVCGDTVIWKPSLKTPLTAVAVQNIIRDVLKAHGAEGVMTLVIGTDPEVGEAMIHDRRVPLISATGSCRMGKHVGQAVAARLGRSLLELGGNNAIIAMGDCDVDMLTRGVLFGAVGTAGQRCTTTRRLILHSSIAKEVTSRLVAAYQQVRIGDPLDERTLMGPLIDDDAVKGFLHAIDAAKAQGGEVLTGGEAIDGEGSFVKPTIIRAHKGMEIWKEETFAPILYVFEVASFEEALELQNGVVQGLSSAIFTDSLRTAERFLSSQGSDCGIANVNIGTSGAEIGGAFGGEKETGGGREAGSDSWKAYMRRQTNTINWSRELPLAQGIKFDA